MIEQGGNILDAVREPDAGVYEKYLKNLRTGRKAFKLDNLAEFTGYNPDHKERISIRAYLREQDNAQILERVIRPIKRLSESCGIELLPAVDLWTTHISIADMRYQQNTKLSKEETFDTIGSAPATVNALQKLKGTPLTFDFLLLDKSISLAASHIPASIIEARGDMSGLAKDVYMDMKDVANIAHITVARMGSKASIQHNRSTNAFGRKIMELHHGLLREPIRAMIDRADIMSNEEFMTKHEAALFDRLKNVQ